MSRPTARKIHGFWPPLLLETQADGRLDLEAVTAGVRYLAAAGVPGLYTADTASEFYTLEFEEWNDLVTHFRAVVRATGLPAGAGCTWTNQAGALRRIARARELGFDNIHLSQPYWVRLNEPAQRTFWRAVAEVAGDLPIIVYSGSQGQLPLDGPLLRRLREYCPAIAGTKSPGFDSVATNSMLHHCPDLCHMVHETVLASWVALGATGCFSNLVGLCPPLAARWFGLMDRGEWGEAFAIQRRVNSFYEEGLIPIRRAGFVADKAMLELGRVPGTSRRLRPPYTPVPDDLYRGLEAAAHRHLPEFTAMLAARG
ncbi:MAG: dihydrodipicolinate synthase family protein [Opitutaceae bacterium]|nr:dihydrodipicolinate synthase family protein [Opitutaceae bacterium]